MKTSDIKCKNQKKYQSMKFQPLADNRLKIVLFSSLSRHSSLSSKVATLLQRKRTVSCKNRKYSPYLQKAIVYDTPYAQQDYLTVLDNSGHRNTLTKVRTNAHCLSSNYLSRFKDTVDSNCILSRGTWLLFPSSLTP